MSLATPHSMTPEALEDLGAHIALKRPEAVLDTKVEIKPAELKMAGQVVESMAEDFNPDQFHDDYQDQLRELVEAKLQGGEAFTADEQPTELDESDDVSVDEPSRDDD